MIIEKSKVIEVLLSRGQDARAAWVAKSLPDEVDTVRNASLLATLRLDPADFVDISQEKGSEAESA
jgi:hypothetical protein